MKVKKREKGRANLGHMRKENGHAEIRGEREREKIPAWQLEVRTRVEKNSLEETQAACVHFPLDQEMN